MLSLDSSNNTFAVLGQIPGYFILKAAEGAIDSVNRKYY